MKRCLYFIGLILCVFGARTDGAPEPRFIYYEGRADQWTDYYHYDLESRWAAVPTGLQPHAWLQVRLPRQRPATPGGTDDLARQWAAAEKGLAYADRRGIAVAIGLPLDSTHALEDKPDIVGLEDVEKLLATHASIKGLFLPEFASCGLQPWQRDRLAAFQSFANKHNLEFRVSEYLHTRYSFPSALMMDPALQGAREKQAAPWVVSCKTVEPIDIMELWGECMGIWLSGITDDWCWEFDSWYWVNRTAAKHGMRRDLFWQERLPNTPQWYVSGQDACPTYLVKDSMILAALTGCRLFATECWRGFAKDEPLRPTFDHTAAFILDRRLVLDKAGVLALTKLAVVAPNGPGEAVDNGYRYRGNGFRNVLWKAIAGIADGGLDLIPNDGGHYMVPIVPPGATNLFRRVLTARDLGKEDTFKKAVAGLSTPRFSASVPEVLVFEAGDLVYVTDSREEDRTTLEFTLTSTGRPAESFALLSSDGTASNVGLPVEQAKDGTWRTRVILFAGQSLLLDAREDEKVATN